MLKCICNHVPLKFFGLFKNDLLHFIIIIWRNQKSSYMSIMIVQLVEFDMGFRK